MPTATDTPEPTSTFTATPTNTRSPTPNRTATAQVLATKQAQSMAELVQSLYGDGYVSSTEGLFYRLPDFQESLAKIDYIRRYLTDNFLSDFVIRADLAWATAQAGANIKYSGCGFYWGVGEDSVNFYIAIFSLDGNVRVHIKKDTSKYLSSAGSGYYGSIDYMQGNAKIMLVVDNGSIQFFVNGKRVYNRDNQYELEGYLYFAISSGINTGFGTRCSFSNVELWDMNP